MKRSPERMKYQKDTRSSALCLLGIAFNVYYFISVFRNDAVVPDVFMGVDVLTNIIFMMLAFLVSEKLKVYAKGWNGLALMLGLAELARIFVLPEHYRRLGMMTGTLYWGAVVSLGLAGLSLILAYLNSTENGRLLKIQAKTAEGD